MSSALIYIIAGENSGDFIAAQIMKRMHHKYKFTGIGGKLMIQAGLECFLSMDEINFMGFINILHNIYKIKKIINATIFDILIKKPNLLITIDAPGFTKRVAQGIKNILNIKIIHIVAPSVWFYLPSRAQKYAKIYDHLLTLFPFEPKFFTKFNLPCSYIGNPILEQDFFLNKNATKTQLFGQNYSTTKLICVTPGSRKCEIKRHMPVLINTLKILEREIMNKFNHHMHVIFVQANDKYNNLITEYLKYVDFTFDVSSHNRLQYFAAADVAIAKSGTNILELLASNTPTVLFYKINYFDYYILKILTYGKKQYISPVNVTAQQEIIPELIQHNCNPASIVKHVMQLLITPQQQTSKTNKIIRQFGLQGNETLKPSAIAAKIIESYIAT